MIHQALASNNADEVDDKEGEEDNDPELSQALDGVECGNGKFDLVFGWEEDIKMSNMEETGNKEWGPSIHAHQTALVLLWDAVSQAHHDRAKFVSSIEGKVSMEVRAHLGSLNWMIHDHGSIGEAMANAIASGKALQKNIQEINDEMTISHNELTSNAKGAKVLKTYLLGIIPKVLDISREGARKADACLE